jgi:hypothetical protein
MPFWIGTKSPSPSLLGRFDNDFLIWPSHYDISDAGIMVLPLVPSAAALAIGYAAIICYYTVRWKCVGETTDCQTRDNEVWLEPTPGHTAGHVAIRIKSQGVEAVFSGDLMHWPMQCIYPDWNGRFDADPEQARRTRRAFLEASSDNGFIVMTSHFPLPSVGTITRRQSSFWFNDHQ